MTNDETIKEPLIAYLLMTLVGGLAAVGMLAILGLSVTEGLTGTVDTKVLNLSIVSTLIGILAALAYAVRRSGWSWIQFRIPSAKQAGLAIAMVPVVLLASYAWSGLLEAFDHPVNPQMFALEIIESGDLGTMAFGLVYAILLAPLLEETVFRGYMLPIMMRVMGSKEGMAVNATLFGLMHSSDPWAIVPTAIIGFVACWLWRKTGSLTVPVLFHTVNNLCAMTMLWLY